MFAVVFICFVITIVLWYQVKYRHRNSILAKIPAPKKLPILHNALIFYGKSPKAIFDWFQEMSSTLGPVYVFTLEPFDDGTVFVSDPKVAEGILTSQKLLDKGFDYDLLKPWLGTGLVVSTGKKWHQRRKILTPAFHFQVLEKFVEIMDEQGRVFVEKLNKYIGEEVDVFPLVNLYALDVICRMYT
jgi:cytochrome P450 family 4